MKELLRHIFEECQPELQIAVDKNGKHNQHKYYGILEAIWDIGYQKEIVGLCKTYYGTCRRRVKGSTGKRMIMMDQRGNKRRKMVPATAETDIQKSQAQRSYGTWV